MAGDGRTKVFFGLSLLAVAIGVFVMINSEVKAGLIYTVIGLVGFWFAFNGQKIVAAFGRGK